MVGYFLTIEYWRNSGCILNFQDDEVEVHLREQGANQIFLPIILGKSGKIG